MMQHLAAHKADIAPQVKAGNGNKAPDSTDNSRGQEFASVLEQRQSQERQAQERQIRDRKTQDRQVQDTQAHERQIQEKRDAEHQSKASASESVASETKPQETDSNSGSQTGQEQQHEDSAASSGSSTDEASQSAKESGEAENNASNNDEKAWRAETAEVAEDVSEEESAKPVIDGVASKPAEHFDWLTMLDKIHGQSRDAVIETDGTVPPPATDIPDEISKLSDLQKALKDVVDAQSQTLEEISAQVHGKTQNIVSGEGAPDDAAEDESLAEILTLIDSLKSKSDVSEEELVQLDQLIDEYMASKPDLEGSPLVALKGEDWMKIDTKLLSGMLQSPNKPELAINKGLEQLETAEKLAQQLVSAEPEQVQKVAEYIAQNVLPKDAATPELKQSFVDKLKSGLEEMKEQLKQGGSGDVSQVVKEALASATEGGANVNVDQAKLQQVLATTSSTLDMAGQLGDARAPVDAAKPATGQVASAREVNAAQVEASRQQQAAQMERTVNMNKPDAPQNLAEKVQVMVNQKNMVAEIRLDPPDMGQMKVKLNLSGETASVNFVVQTQHAKEALEHAAPRLKELLDEQGIELGQSSVQQESNQQGQGEEGELARGGTAQGDGNPEAEEEFTEQQTVRVVNGSVNGIDYFA